MTCLHPINRVLRKWVIGIQHCIIIIVDSEYGIKNFGIFTNFAEI